jgi:hypothetical protein
LKELAAGDQAVSDSIKNKSLEDKIVKRNKDQKLP